MNTCYKQDIGSSTTRNVTCQATSEEDRRKWMGVMDGKQPEIKSSLSSGINSGKIVRIYLLI